MKAKITDVAGAAGVSASTVSRAFTNPHLLRADTRDHVLQVAARMDYTPNVQARGLASGKTTNIGLVVPDVANAFFPPFIKAAQSRARERDRDIFLADSDENALVEAALVKRLREQVDGLLICSSRLTDAALLELAGRLPVVLFNRSVPGIASVRFDSNSGTRQVVEHLASLGHTRISYVGGPAESWADQHRRTSLMEIAETHRMTVIDTGPHVPSLAAGIQAADAVLTTSATGVIAFDDTMAIGVISRLTARGVRVPEDMSVVGHDDINVAAMFRPALSTVRVSCTAAGRVATDLLLQLSLEQPATAESPDVLLPSQLIIRESSGPSSG
jgi:DNA-binding LacI/PurR family transcriptional regulator